MRPKKHLCSLLITFAIETLLFVLDEINVSRVVTGFFACFVFSFSFSYRFIGRFRLNHFHLLHSFLLLPVWPGRGGGVRVMCCGFPLSKQKTESHTSTLLCAKQPHSTSHACGCLRLCRANTHHDHGTYYPTLTRQWEARKKMVD